ncbi:hypothetical protein [uncultured Clostridium sp.]|uniref:collagen-like triple helix repeat-containing protein n=1 Tax=uncultured Clostridium sp. TaxID=59620 RepID=UPI00262D5052|nr:hypothetical protein [uncultured Clostridium sp.]
MAAVLDALLYTFNSEDSTLEYSEAIKFNFDYSSDKDILFKKNDNSTFCILKPGKYLINWWVGTQSGSYGTSVSFGIKYMLDNKPTYKVSSTPLKTGYLSGNTILDIHENQLPFEFELVNLSGFTEQQKSVVVLALDTVVQAGMTAMEIAPKGEKGDNGLIGPKGDEGHKGNPGPRGERGSVGPRGLLGPRGLTGDRGLRGLTGDKGVKGNLGPSGTARKLSSSSSSVKSKDFISIPSKSAIIFNEVDISFVMDGDKISRDSAIVFEGNGDITFEEIGLYDLAWYLCIEGIEQVSEFSFSVIKVIDNIPNFESPLIKCTYPQLIVGATHAQGLIPITEKTTIRLINSSVPSGNNSGQGQIQLTRNIEVKGRLKIIAYTIGK